MFSKLGAFLRDLATRIGFAEAGTPAIVNVFDFGVLTHLLNINGKAHPQAHGIANESKLEALNPLIITHILTRLVNETAFGGPQTLVVPLDLASPKAATSAPLGDW